MNVKVGKEHRHFRTVAYDQGKNRVVLIEQRLLPHSFKTITTRNYRETAAAIKEMVVRGAGAIGATAAYGLAQGVAAFKGKDLGKFEGHCREVYQTLKEARPTAVDPVNAMNTILERMLKGET